MKKLASLMIFVGLLTATPAGAETNAFDFTVKSIKGEEVSLKKYAGKVLLIVNVASQCGSTGQYAGLEALWQHFEEAGLVVMGFPSNEYGGQEPGTNDEILTFCQDNYGVTFPMFEKVAVKGDDQIPLFKYLTSAETPDGTGGIGWNFEKILVGRNGEVLRRFKSYHEPDGPEIVEAIQSALSKKAN